MTDAAGGFETLIVTQEEGLTVITLNRPDVMNTINLTMVREMTETMESIRRDDQVRAVLLRARGQAFCAGAELSNAVMDGNIAFQIKDMLAVFNKMYLSVLDSEKPVVGAVNGVAAGGGFALVLCCDIVVASDAAEFSAIYTRRGIMSDVGVSYLLPRMVGLHKAKELIFTSDVINAEEAYRIGLVNKLTSRETLEEDASAFARCLASGATKAIGLSKTLIHRGLNMSLADAMEWETWGQGLCSQTEDVLEGWKAFFEKREPHFRGR
jgi:2-(1,2-epoxy-1,2-dihydrophenyl)acetyl-CoA isomerase